MTKFKSKIGFCNILFISITGQVFAADEPFAPIAHASIAYDDNVFLLTDPLEGETTLKDTVIELGAGFRSNLMPSNQRFLIEGDIFKRNYSTFNRLDFTGGKFNAQWDWQASKKWDGEISYLFNREQSNLGDQRLPNGDVYDSNQLSLNVIRHLNEKNILYMSTFVNKKEYEQRASLDSEQADVTLGYRHTSNKKNTIAIELSNSNGENISDGNNFLSIPDVDLNAYEQDSIYLVTQWNFGGSNILNSSIGYTSRELDGSLSEFDYDGVLYELSYVWKVGYRTEITPKFGKQLANTENTQSLFTVSNFAQLDAKWDASEKIQLSASVKYQDIDFTQIEDNRDDQTTSLILRSRYRLSSMLYLDLSLRDQSRSSNILTNEFDNSTGMLSVIYNPQ